MHVTCAVPRPDQKVECIIDSANYADRTLQLAAGLVRAKTSNSREDFEASSSSLIEVDPYSQSSRSTGCNDNTSSIEFNACRESSGVDLR